ncbi:DNA polymerase Y family protein [Amycolatopsis roodepoortensis]|uniref:Y-family DNA polymerase n=1 Tax=Amycolatopsis roodepoortensis TaxID=700274 RepID=UPI00214C2B76|nr:DNA polymerase Y family protein [Amycolatopsis roodepoortensis]UUV32071.1 DNA polymerase Y family protein [Amycolatopsis roodepoortensis]
MATVPDSRLLACWVPDWPVVAAAAAAQIPVQHPAAVFLANRVVACSARARSFGVARGMRRRDAQSRCPDLAVLAHDGNRDASLFEAVASTVETHAPGIEVVRPGIVAVPAAGAASYAGSEQALAELLVDHVSAAAGVECQVGVADGVFAAILAARSGMFVEPGQSPVFLAPRSLSELDQPGSGRAELVGTLNRLGLRTLGDFARLPERAVASRFGQEAVTAHRLARGVSVWPLSRRRPPPELAVEKRFDPILDRVDATAFAAKALGSTLHVSLAERGLACAQLAISATTETGQTYTRTWRAAEPLTAQGISDRVRWQIDGWLLRRTAEDRPSSGIEVLRLEPVETVSGGSLQMAFPAAGSRPDADERAARALGRVQGMLGPDAVFTATLGGGRGPGEQVRLIPWGAPREAPGDPAAPWPGRLPAPSPATVPPVPWAAAVRGVSGELVGWTSRGRLTEAPAVVTVTDRPPRRVARWAGPWPAGKPWCGGGDSQAVRVQVVLAEDEPGNGEIALLLNGNLSGSVLQWTVEGLYD